MTVAPRDCVIFHTKTDSSQNCCLIKKSVQNGQNISQAFLLKGIFLCTRWHDFLFPIVLRKIFSHSKKQPPVKMIHDTSHRGFTARSKIFHSSFQKRTVHNRYSQSHQHEHVCSGHQFYEASKQHMNYTALKKVMVYLTKLEGKENWQFPINLTFPYSCSDYPSSTLSFMLLFVC